MGLGFESKTTRWTRADDDENKLNDLIIAI
jgi:hypothetical protein